MRRVVDRRFSSDSALAGRLGAGIRSRLRPRWLAAGAVALAVLAVAPTAQAGPSGRFGVPYADDICFTHTHQSIVRLTEEVACGPTPAAPTPTDFVKYSWSPSIYAVMRELENFPSFEPVTRVLSYEQWAFAGLPAPLVVTHVPGTVYYTFVYSDEVFAETLSGEVRKLTFEEWAAAGFPPPQPRAANSYAKLSWAPGIAFMYSIDTGHGQHITFEEWAAAGYPTPQVFQRFPNDVFCRPPTSSVEIRYFGPTHLGLVTSEQWVEAGSPPLSECS